MHVNAPILFIFVSIASTVGSHFIAKQINKGIDALKARHKKIKYEKAIAEDRPVKPIGEPNVFVRYVIYFSLMACISITFFVLIKLFISIIAPSVDTSGFVITFTCILVYMAIVMMYIGAYNFKNYDNRMFTVYLISVCSACVFATFLDRILPTSI
jgi:hypothetical protein